MADLFTNIVAFLISIYLGGIKGCSGGVEGGLIRIFDPKHPIKGIWNNGIQDDHLPYKKVCSP